MKDNPMTDTITDAMEDISQDPDAVKWAARFAKTFPDSELAQDDVMIGWFANAQMAMHDFLENGKISELQTQLSQSNAEIERLRGLLGLMMPKNVCVTNPNIPGDLKVHLEISMSELRQIKEASIDTLTTESQDG